jgi:ABC-2 type transport system ATP-binding protein
MLEVRNLKKSYGGFEAVKGISFTLSPGDIFGFIGSNGAGKTTTIKMLATLLEPTSGTAILFGADITQDPMAIRKMIGYMPDFFGLYEDVKVWEYLDFFATIYRVPTTERAGVIDNVLELTDLTLKKDSFVQSLSRGMQQRLCLARCLVHDPKLLLLDEPASGLDPRARAELKELILELGRMGKIIIVSSHILPELSTFCNKVGIIERGVMLAQGPMSDIIASLRPHRIVCIKVLDDPDPVITYLCGHASVASAHEEEIGIVVEFNGNDESQVALLRDLIDAGHRVISFSDAKLDLEEVFMSITSGAVN